LIFVFKYANKPVIFYKLVKKLIDTIMKTGIPIILFLLFSLNCFAQHKADSIKKGWNPGFLPAIAFDSDLGLFYGIIVNAYDYGDGKIYPNYHQSILFQVAGYSRGSSEHYIEYDSYTLLPSVRFLSRVRYVGNKAYPFYGFNGNQSYYNQAFEDVDSPEYKSRMFYRLDRKLFQVYANVQDTIGNSKFQWHIGWEMGSYKIDTVNITGINKKLKEGDRLPHTPTLYDQYTDWGLIRNSEKNGGLMNSFMVGLLYDSRNKLTNPDKGIYTELSLRWMPSFLNKNHFSGLSLGLIHKQYFTVIKKRLTFAYRLWFEAKLGGDPAYYTDQLLTTFASTEGYGGFNTLRGVLMNRIVTSDFILGNFELRSRLINFRFIKQNWYLGAIAFMDAGRILKPVNVNLNLVNPANQTLYFRGKDRTIHSTLGGGLKLAMNENFVLSAEYAKPFDPQDGLSGLYLGLNYLF
jgi:outer membrane protein assembly factor BamA